MTEIRHLSDTLKLGLLRLDEFSSQRNIHNRREAEKEGAVFLLNELFPNEKVRLMYRENGKPYAENKTGGISISHSHHLLAILVDHSNIHTGLDVELIRDKVLKIRHKFLSEREQNFIPKDNVMMHLAAWCIKETIYKIYAEGMLDFRENIHIDEFSEQSSLVKVKCIKENHTFNKTIQISRQEEYLMAWPID